MKGASAAHTHSKDPKVAPALQQHMDELSKAKVQDNLRHKIDHRPTREELVEQKILGKDGRG